MRHYGNYEFLRKKWSWDIKANVSNRGNKGLEFFSSRKMPKRGEADCSRQQPEIGYIKRLVNTGAF